MKICDYEKKIEESEMKLKQQQNRCETVRTERNLYSKNLIEAKVEYFSPVFPSLLILCGFFSGLLCFLLKGKLTGLISEMISEFLCGN